MCEPASIIAIATTVASTALTAASQAQQSSVQAAQARYGARAAQQNALLAARQAAFDEDRQRENARRLLGTQRARGASAGLDLSGSLLDVAGRTAEDQELDALAIRYGGAVKARSYEDQARLSSYEAANADASLGPRLGATLLGGLSSLGGTLGG